MGSRSKSSTSTSSTQTTNLNYDYDLNQRDSRAGIGGDNAGIVQTGDGSIDASTNIGDGAQVGDFSSSYTDASTQIYDSRQDRSIAGGIFGGGAGSRQIVVSGDANQIATDYGAIDRANALADRSNRILQQRNLDDRDRFSDDRRNFADAYSDLFRRGEDVIADNNRRQEEQSAAYRRSLSQLATRIDERPQGEAQRDSDNRWTLAEILGAARPPRPGVPLVGGGTYRPQVLAQQPNPLMGSITDILTSVNTAGNALVELQDAVVGQQQQNRSNAADWAIYNASAPERDAAAMLNRGQQSQQPAAEADSSTILIAAAAAAALAFL